MSETPKKKPSPVALRIKPLESKVTPYCDIGIPEADVIAYFVSVGADYNGTFYGRLAAVADY